MAYLTSGVSIDAGAAGTGIVAGVLAVLDQVLILVGLSGSFAERSELFLAGR